MWNRQFVFSLLVGVSILGLVQGQQSVKDRREEKAQGGGPIRPVLGAPDSAVAQGPTQLPEVRSTQAPPTAMLGPPEIPAVKPQITIREDTGDGVGYTRGYASIEGFLPLFQTPGQSVIFLDARGVNFLDEHRWEWNAGLGIRFLLPRTDWVIGANTFFDWRDTGPSVFRQVGFGFEALGPIIDLRGNYYLPVGSHRNQIADGGFSNPQFGGHNILLDHLRTYENAMRGFDLEIGAPVPFMERFGLRGYTGFYHYENTGVQTINGVRGRLEAQLHDNVTGYVQVQNDSVFNTTVSGGVALHWGRRRPTSSTRTALDRLGQRVVRDPNIVISQSSEKTKEAALDPNTGQPIIVQHANSAATPGGDGTVERPYQTLGQLQAGSASNQILFLHAGSVFFNQSIKLQNMQRLLGEGTTHQFTALQGTLLLPRATSNIASPLINNGSPGVVLAADNEVSGLAYQNAGGGTFVVGSGNLGNFSINRNAVATNGTGIDFINVAGRGLISENTFSFNSIGVNLLQNTKANFVAVIEKNNFVGGIKGVTVFQADANYTLAIRSNRFTSTTSVEDKVSGVSAQQTLQLRDNIGIGPYLLTGVAGTFYIENVLGTNTPTPITAGTIILVPAGSSGL